VAQRWASGRADCALALERLAPHIRWPLMDVCTLESLQRARGSRSTPRLQPFVREALAYKLASKEVKEAMALGERVQPRRYFLGELVVFDRLGARARGRRAQRRGAEGTRRARTRARTRASEAVGRAAQQRSTEPRGLAGWLAGQLLACPSPSLPPSLAFSDSPPLTPHALPCRTTGSSAHMLDLRLAPRSARACLRRPERGGARAQAGGRVHGRPLAQV
jgi:hypothetical protein